MQDRLLPAMSPKASEAAKKFLEDFGVDVRLGAAVSRYDGECVHFSDGSTLDSVTVIWAAGVTGDPPEGLSEDVITKGNRLVVNEYNQVKGLSNVWAIGDIAAMVSEEHPHGHPQLAPVAMQQGRHLGDNFRRLLKKQSLEPFAYYDKGTMATIGRNRAVADLPFGMHPTGLIAWFMWMLVHLLFLVGFRNKVSVLIDWMINYFSYDRSVRIIVRPAERAPSQRIVEHSSYAAD
jgi:NADH dehydrogenase